MASCPDEIAEFLDGTTCNHNPVIGTTQKDTLQNVLDMLGVFQELILFSQISCVEFDVQTTSGIACIMSCIILGSAIDRLLLLQTCMRTIHGAYRYKKWAT